MSFSIRLTDEEKQLVGSYAKIHSITIGEALFEKIEDEYDLSIANASYDEYIKSGKQSKPINELWRELDL